MLKSTRFVLFICFKREGTGFSKSGNLNLLTVKETMVSTDTQWLSSNLMSNSFRGSSWLTCPAQVASPTLFPPTFPFVCFLWLSDLLAVWTYQAHLPSGLDITVFRILHHHDHMASCKKLSLATQFKEQPSPAPYPAALLLPIFLLTRLYFSPLPSWPVEILHIYLLSVSPSQIQAV